MLESLLSHKGRRDRFVTKCIDGTRHATNKHLFEQGLGSLYESRWGCVVMFCKKLFMVIQPLVAAWDDRKYTVGHEGEQRSQFDATIVTTVVRSPFFRAYLEFACGPIKLWQNCKHGRVAASAMRILWKVSHHIVPTRSGGYSSVRRLLSAQCRGSDCLSL